MYESWDSSSKFTLLFGHVGHLSDFVGLCNTFYDTMFIVARQDVKRLSTFR